MKKIITNISLLLIVATFASSCERKTLTTECLCTSTMLIPIDVDWSVCGVTPQNVTLLIYNKENGDLYYEHYYEHNIEDIQSYVRLGEGEYTAVVFNELRDQINYISCVDHQNLYTLKFESETSTPLRSRLESRGYVSQVGDLAVATIENIEITQEKILEAESIVAEYYSSTKAAELSASTKSTVESLLDVQPTKKSSTIEINAHITGIHNARTPALVDLINLADGYYVYGDQNSSSTSTLQFTTSDIDYDDGSTRDGVISTTITTFGTLSDRSSTSGHDDDTAVTLDILFQLINESSDEVNLTKDVTDDITHTQLSDGSYYITINTTFTDALPDV
ncbi:MAG: DUF5119 domain-containing protein, partial [Rikenellaceae bacterium]